MTAATAVNTRPQLAMASASEMDPAAGSPSAIRAADITSASTTFAVRAISRPAVSAACRPTAAEPTSSIRPVSSSALVCLITMKMLISPAPSAAKPPYRQAVSEPSELPYSGP